MYTVININIKAEMWNIWKDKSYDRLKYDMFRKTRWIGINLSLEMWLKNIKPVPLSWGRWI